MDDTILRNIWRHMKVFLLSKYLLSTSGKVEFVDSYRTCLVPSSCLECGCEASNPEKMCSWARGRNRALKYSHSLIYLNAIGMNTDRLHNSNYTSVLIKFLFFIIYFIKRNITYFWSVFWHSQVSSICGTISQRRDVTSVRLQ